MCLESLEEQLRRSLGGKREESENRKSRKSLGGHDKVRYLGSRII